MDKELEEADKFRYLGNIVQKNGDGSEEIRESNRKKSERHTE